MIVGKKAPQKVKKINSIQGNKHQRL